MKNSGLKNHGESHAERVVKLTQRLYAGQRVTSALIRQTYGVSWATAKRDLAVLKECLPVRVRVRPGKGCAVVHEIKLEIAA